MSSFNLNILETDIIYNISSYSTEREISNIVLINKLVYEKVNNEGKLLFETYKKKFINILDKIMKYLTILDKDDYYKELIKIYENDKNQLFTSNNEDSLKSIMANHLKNINFFLNNIGAISKKNNPIIEQLCNDIVS